MAKTLNCPRTDLPEKNCPAKYKMKQHLPKDVECLILQFNRQILPQCIEDLIYEFHDKYNTIENKKRINFVIESGYRNWLTSQNCYTQTYTSLELEYLGKMSVWLPNPFYFFSWIGFEQVFPVASEWRVFLENFYKVDREFYRRKLKVGQLDLIL